MLTETMQRNLRCVMLTHDLQLLAGVFTHCHLATQFRLATTLPHIESTRNKNSGIISGR